MGGIFVREHAKAVQLYDDVVVLHGAGSVPSCKELFRIEKETDPALCEGISTYRVWYRRSSIPKLSYLRYLSSILRAYRAILTEGFKPNVIHAHIYNAGVPAVLIGRINRVPVVVTEHSTLFSRKLLSPIGALEARIAFGWADLVLPVSYSLQRAIEDYHIRACFQIIPNVVDTVVFSPPRPDHHQNDPTRILFVGLLDSSQKKGVPYLLQALDQLRKHRDDWHLDIVGDGPARSECERIAADLGLTAKVTFCGLKPKREVAEFMRQADLFVLPSIWENCPCVAIEAMASGLPIVSTLAGGIPEIVSEDVGVLVPPGDPLRLSSALGLMIQSLARFDRLGIAQKAARYSYESIGRLIHSVYLDCVR